MRLVRFNALSEPVSRARTGVLLAGDIVGDLRAGYSAYLVEEAKDPQGRELAGLRIPPDVRQILHVGQPARLAVERSAAWLTERHAKNPEGKGLDGETLFVPLAGARLHNPLKPGRLIVVEKNARAGVPPVVRDCSPASAMGPIRDISMPASVDRLAYGTALAIVIGCACHALEARDAWEAVAGYMVANVVHATPSAASAEDLAGDVTFSRCIIGPCLVDRHDAPDVHSLHLTTRVNGVVVQTGATSSLRWPIDRLIARLSRYGLEAGDTIVTGLLSDDAPAGSSATPYLRVGDLLESGIEGLGILRNRVASG
ncbi:MAG: fumarylacetoacetate hydrolase family protein [Betaproteobacteria bacterium]|nr:fumarylacetoacetate hydrolase family protein [Betaproteobacteria bacterium]